MKNLLWMIFIIPSLAYAQESGIKFEASETWQQVKDKARIENKYIFVDCYATWCGPCKTMDQSVYPDAELGKFVNEHFISIKLQMDSSKSDPADVKLNYAAANALQKHYQVTAYPAFLFFSPNGELVHRGIGAQNVTDFLALAEEALDPGKQLYTLYRKYNSGEKSNETALSLIESFEKVDQKAAADSIARDYIKSLSNDQILQKDRIEFIRSHSSFVSTADPVFRVFYDNRQRIDSIMSQPGCAVSFITTIIGKNEVAPFLAAMEKNHQPPHWERLNGMLSKKYDAGVSTAVLLQTEMNWYKKHKEWANYATALVALVKFRGADNLPKEFTSLFYLNGAAWEVFLHSNKKEELETAISWENTAMTISDKDEPAVLDTKANLLYKLGKVKDAIETEKKAVNAAGQQDKPFFLKTVTAMENGKPTWLNNQ